MLLAFLIHFDGAVDGIVEAIARGKAHGAGHQEKAQANDGHVAKVQQVRDEHVALELEEVENAIEEHEERGWAGRDDGGPPPTVVLRHTAQMRTKHRGEYTVS